MLLSDGPTRSLDCLPQLLPIRDALDVISGKWKLLILTAVMRGNHRFGEVEAQVPGISPKVLARELKELEAHQLICRTVHTDQHPVLIEYTITDYTRSLKPVLLELHAWGVGHRKRVMTSDY